MAERNPSIPEQRLYWKVFRESLPDPYRIFISDDLGKDNRPYVMARWFRRPTSWTINIGPDGYRNATQKILGTWGDRIDTTFIHELVHVWQGYHSVFFDSYMLKSLWGEVTVDDPYAYTLGENWNDYRVEQKSEIVGDWYKNGMKASDPRYFYIEKHIRVGHD